MATPVSRDILNKETNARFWAQTGYKPGQRLDPTNALDAAKMPVWRDIFSKVSAENAAGTLVTTFDRPEVAQPLADAEVASKVAVVHVDAGASQPDPAVAQQHAAAAATAVQVVMQKLKEAATYQPPTVSPQLEHEAAHEAARTPLAPSAPAIDQIAHAQMQNGQNGQSGAMLRPEDDPWDDRYVARTPNGAPSPRAANGQPSPEALIKETNARFWVSTQYKPGQKLDMTLPEDRRQSRVWLRIFGEVQDEATAGRLTFTNPELVPASDRTPGPPPRSVSPPPPPRRPRPAPRAPQASAAQPGMQVPPPRPSPEFGGGSSSWMPPGGTMPMMPPGGNTPWMPPGGTMPMMPPGGTMPMMPPGGTTPWMPPGGTTPMMPPGGNTPWMPPSGTMPMMPPPGRPNPMLRPPSPVPGMQPPWLPSPGLQFSTPPRTMPGRSGMQPMQPMQSMPPIQSMPPMQSMPPTAAAPTPQSPADLSSFDAGEDAGPMAAETALVPSSVDSLPAVNPAPGGMSTAAKIALALLGIGGLTGVVYAVTRKPTSGVRAYGRTRSRASARVTADMLPLTLSRGGRF